MTLSTYQRELKIYFFIFWFTILTTTLFTERPAAPMGPLIVSDVTSASLNLTWEASPYDGGMEITNYYIEKLEKSQKHWQKVAEVGADVRTYMVSELVEGHEYFFRVFAVNALGLSESLEVSETILIKSPFGKILPLFTY